MVVAAVLASSLLAVGQPARGWGRGHFLIRSWAVDKLPDWQRDLFQETHWKGLLSDYLSLQDRHAGGNAPELDAYCVVPGQRVSLHDVNPPEPSVRAMAWYLERVAEGLRSGEVVPFLVDQAMDADRQLHPLAFPGEGKETQVLFGLGMGAPFSLDYTIAPGGVFERLTCRVGLHSAAGAEGKVTFALAVNGQVVERTEPIPSGAQPKAMTVRLPKTPVVKLTLQTIPAEGSRSEHNLAVWAEPTLHRAAPDREPQDP